MHISIEIDDQLMRDALAATGARTQNEVVELGLRTLIRLRRQEKLLELKGAGWMGDLPDS